MTRKIKGLGLAFVAIAAMSMAAAAGAQASELHATTPNTAEIFGHQVVTHPVIFTTTAGKVECTQSTLEGTISNTDAIGNPVHIVGAQQTTEQEVTLTPTVTGCKAFGQAEQTLMNGCKYTITNKNVATQNHTTALTAWLDITGCTAGKQIEIKTGICTMTVPEQHHLSHIVFKNTPAAVPHDVDATATITGIKYENHGITCPNYGGKTTELRADGQLVGETTLQARVDTGFQQVTLHGHQYNQTKQTGALVGLIAT